MALEFLSGLMAELILVILSMLRCTALANYLGWKVMEQSAFIRVKC